jgi:uncharacterized protein YdiU (UPF0061 family)
MAISDAAAMLVRLTAAHCAQTVAAQMVAGFVHGVLNSDNINVTGESFDYGPWRFTPTWDPAFTAAYFDHRSLYAFGRQPQVVHWTVGQLAISLRSITPAEPLVVALEAFGPAYEDAIAAQTCWRLGVAATTAEQDRALVIAGERYMRTTAMPIDQFFAGGVSSADDGALVDTLSGRAATRTQWWQSTPPQSLHIEEVEALWDAIASRDDWRPLMAKVDAVRAMGRALGPPPIALR